MKTSSLLNVTRCAFAILSVIFLNESSLAKNASIRFRLPSAPITLDWQKAKTSNETYIVLNLMEGLFQFDQDLNLKPALAESWKASKDGKTVTIKIRSGVNWSDGIELTAQHFIDSWVRLIRLGKLSAYSGFLSEVKNFENFQRKKVSLKKFGIRKKGKYEIEIDLETPPESFLKKLTFWATYPIRRDLIQKHGEAWTAVGKIVTLGPYTLESRQVSSLKLVKNRKYHSRVGGPEAVEIAFEKDDEKARKNFRSGLTSLFLSATTQDFINSKGYSSVKRFPYLSTFYLGFNHTQNPTRNAYFRKAIELAIDRKTIPSELQGGQVPAYGLIPPKLPGHITQESKPDPFRARKTLAKAGYAEGKGLKKLKLLMRSFDGAEKLATSLTERLKRVLGIQILPAIVNPSQFERENRAGKYNLIISHWGADLPDPIDFYNIFVSDNANNRTRWSNSEYDFLVQLAAKERNSKKRGFSFEKASEILLQKESAIVPLFHQQRTVLLGPKIKDLKVNPLNYFYFHEIELK